MTLIWRGDEVARRVLRASAAATGEIVDLAVETARGDTPVETGALAGSLRRENEGLDVGWGYHVRYGIFVEIGARGRAGVHALRRSADRHYPRLASAIRARLGL